MTKRRVQNLMRRAGVNDVPLAQCRDLKELNEALAKMSDAALLAAWRRTLRIAATRLSDDELLRQLAEARKEEEQEH